MADALAVGVRRGLLLREQVGGAHGVELLARHGRGGEQLPEAAELGAGDGEARRDVAYGVTIPAELFAPHRSKVADALLRK